MKYTYTDQIHPDYPEEYMPVILYPIKKDKYAISNYGHLKNVQTGNVLAVTEDSSGYKHKLSAHFLNDHN